MNPTVLGPHHAVVKGRGAANPHFPGICSLVERQIRNKQCCSLGFLRVWWAMPGGECWNRRFNRAIQRYGVTTGGNSECGRAAVSLEQNQRREGLIPKSLEINCLAFVCSTKLLRFFLHPLVPYWLINTFNTCLMSIYFLQRIKWAKIPVHIEWLC